MTKHIAIVGAGQIGSRHLQALALLERTVRISVIDPSKESLGVAEERFKQVSSEEQQKNVAYFRNLTELSSDVELAIIATNADVRKTVIDQLLEKVSVSYFILEKIVFQAFEDFDYVCALFQQRQIKAWVNCPRRQFPFYRNLKNELSIETPVLFQVSGGNWDLGGNSIHTLDLFAFLTDTPDIKIFGNGLISVDNKRTCFNEFAGTLIGTTTKGHQIILCSLPESKAPNLIQIITAKERYVLSESEQKALKSTKNNHWQSEVLDLPILNQSQLTQLAVEEILDKGTCVLTTLEESYILHKPLLNVFLKHLNKISDQVYTYCPVT